jgi:two-component system chemotaxis sensor kinase CheA
VRELAKKKNKEMELVLTGEDNEIDKTIIEEINDPLLHLVRNAGDHGIETPEARAQKGKPPKGTIHLRAFHESGNVVIQVEDDGKGMDTKIIKDKALKNGIITHEQAERMSEQEALNLIFMPGFSTAEEVTDVSGRGVGMDVVKTNIEKLRGKIYIETEVNKGSRITLKLPLTMAMIETLMVDVGQELFAIPILSVSTIARVKSSQIQTVQGNEMVLLHGKTIEAVRMGDILNISYSKAKDKVYLVVLEVKDAKGDDIQMGLIVDAVQDKQKIVIKPLDDSLVGTYGFSGASILGDGKMALIIDPAEFIELALRKINAAR